MGSLLSYKAELLTQQQSLANEIRECLGHLPTISDAFKDVCFINILMMPT